MCGHTQKIVYCGTFAYRVSRGAFSSAPADGGKVVGDWSAVGNDSVPPFVRFHLLSH